jgi:hypothetical protein
MHDRPTSYLLPALEVRPVFGHGGHGIFARSPVPAGTVLTVWGGWVIPAAEFLSLPPARQRQGIQVEEALFLLAPGHEPSEHFNHSCDPNAEMSGQIALAARRDIDESEEVRFDYAMVDTLHYDEFDCDCGAAGCRVRITGEDWRRPDLWARYGNGFSPFLRRRIDRLAAELALQPMDAVGRAASGAIPRQPPPPPAATEHTWPGQLA